jgi:hypothetical protein
MMRILMVVLLACMAPLVRAGDEYKPTLAYQAVPVDFTKHDDRARRWPDGVAGGNC